MEQAIPKFEPRLVRMCLHSPSGSFPLTPYQDEMLRARWTEIYENGKAERHSVVAGLNFLSAFFTLMKMRIAISPNPFITADHFLSAEEFWQIARDLPFEPHRVSRHKRPEAVAVGRLMYSEVGLPFELPDTSAADEWMMELDFVDTLEGSLEELEALAFAAPNDSAKDYLLSIVQERQASDRSATPNYP